MSYRTKEVNGLETNNVINLDKANYICKEDYFVDYIPDETVNEAYIRKIEAAGMSMAEFSRRSGLAEISIVRYREKLSEPTLESIVLHCITLHTNVFDSLYLISKAGYNLFCSDDKKIYFLLIILSRYCGIDVQEANAILKSLGMKPLSKK